MIAILIKRLVLCSLIMSHVTFTADTLEKTLPSFSHITAKMAECGVPEVELQEVYEQWETVISRHKSNLAWLVTSYDDNTKQGDEYIESLCQDSKELLTSILFKMTKAKGINIEPDEVVEIVNEITLDMEEYIKTELTMPEILLYRLS